MNRRVYLYFLVTIVLGAILGGVGIYYFCGIPAAFSATRVSTKIVRWRT